MVRSMIRARVITYIIAALLKDLLDQRKSTHTVRSTEIISVLSGGKDLTDRVDQKESRWLIYNKINIQAVNHDGMSTKKKGVITYIMIYLLILRDSGRSIMKEREYQVVG